MSKRFTELVKDFLTKSRSPSNAQAEAYKKYVKKYQGETVLKENAEATRFFQAGKIYAFKYNTAGEINKDRPFVNHLPVIISVGGIQVGQRVFEMGIDLVAIPYEMRVMLLDRFTQYFEKQLSMNEKAIQNGRTPSARISLDYNKAKTLFEGTGWQQAFFLFDKQKIVSPVIYENQDWPELAFLYTRGMRGQTTKEIYEAYIKRIRSKNDPMKELLSNKAKL